MEKIHKVMGCFRIERGRDKEVHPPGWKESLGNVERRKGRRGTIGDEMKAWLLMGQARLLEKKQQIVLLGVDQE